MKKRTRIVILAVCALMLYLTAANALAAEPKPAKSRASVEYGSNTKVAGVNQTLLTNGLTGIVFSESGTGSVDQRMMGRMCTRGLIFIITRDEAKVSPGKKADLGWKNPDKETGTFFAEAQAPFKNHEGYCLVQQARK